MKIVFFSLLCLILIGMTSYSYAQFTQVDKNTKSPEILLQFQVRDPNGSLIAYIETDQVTSFDPLALNRFLDSLNHTGKEFFIKDDKKYERQQWEIPLETFDKKLAFSTTFLRDVYQHEVITVIAMRHDSFQTKPGDTIRIFWTTIRPVS